MITITDDSFQKEVKNFQGLVLIDFWAVWCGPCQMLTPILEELSKEYPDVKFCKMDVDANQVIPQQEQISGIPAVKFFKNGEKVDEIIGAQPKEAFIEKINKYK